MTGERGRPVCDCENHSLGQVVTFTKVPGNEDCVRLPVPDREPSADRVANGLEVSCAVEPRSVYMAGVSGRAVAHYPGEPRSGYRLDRTFRIEPGSINILRLERLPMRIEPGEQLPGYRLDRSPRIQPGSEDEPGVYLKSLRFEPRE